MTTINFHRSGGVVGNVIQLHLNLNELPADEAQHLTRLIMEADFFKIPENLAARSTTDEFQYTITVAASQATHTVKVTDTTMPSDLVPLVKELTIMQAAR
ncbi:MAG: hypothetical protein QM730_24135 [Anaerolineales bacterium]